MVAGLIILLDPFSEPARYYSGARVISARFQTKAFAEALSRYHKDCQDYPSDQAGLFALLTDPGVAGWNGPYLNLDSIPTGPWNRPYKYSRASAPEIPIPELPTNKPRKYALRSATWLCLLGSAVMLIKLRRAG